MATPALKLHDVRVTFGHCFKALDDISAEVPAGQITGFIGPSGAGKTTLIRAIVGRQRTSGGSIEVLGQRAGSAALRHVTSYMTQEPSVYRDLTVVENLHYFAVMIGVPRREVGAAVTAALRAVDLEAQAHQVVASVSGGQRQRVSLAIALLGQPKLLVLDEPTVGLDPVLREQLWKLFRQLARDGATVVVSSHVMDEAERCDQLLLVRDGKLLAQGSPAELCQRTGTTSVEASFLKLVGNTS